MSLFFFFNDTATTEIYTLSLHDALPISVGRGLLGREDLRVHPAGPFEAGRPAGAPLDLGRHLGDHRNQRGVGVVAWVLGVEPFNVREDYQQVGIRSEERRVGKECRSRWSPYH